MNRSVCVRGIGIALLCAAAMGWAPGAGAALPPVGSTVEDHAGVLSPGQQEEIRGRLAELERTHGIEAVVVTIGSIADYDPARPSIETFATRLFNAIGIGDAERNDGALLLVAVTDRRVRIEVGSGWGHRLDASMQRVIDRFMVTRFKAGDYGGGIVAGVDRMAVTLARARPGLPPGLAVSGGSAAQAAAGSPGGGSESPAAESSAGLAERPPAAAESSPVVESPRPAAPVTRRADPRTSPSPPPAGRSRRFLIGWASLLHMAVVVGIVLLVIVAVVVSRRPKRCTACGDRMTLIPDTVDEYYLDEGQKLEEAFGSVDYQVWSCLGCNRREVIPRRRNFSRYTRCPRCERLTVETTTSIEQPATYTSTGVELLRRVCHHCDFQEESRQTLSVRIPLETRDRERRWGLFDDDRHGSSRSGDRSGGGSFDWGSSGGGSSSGSSSSSGGGRSSGGGASGSW